MKIWCNIQVIIYRLNQFPGKENLRQLVSSILTFINLLHNLLIEEMLYYAYLENDHIFSRRVIKNENSFYFKRPPKKDSQNGLICMVFTFQKTWSQILDNVLNDSINKNKKNFI